MIRSFASVCAISMTLFLLSPSFARDRAAPTMDKEFLVKLQQAIGTNNRQSVINLVRLPLRVNGPGGKQVQIYRNQKSILRDYDSIFSAKVRQAVLAQRPNTLFHRDDGTMIGDGEIWFGAVCVKAICSKRDALKIYVVNRR